MIAGELHISHGYWFQTELNALFTPPPFSDDECGVIRNLINGNEKPLQALSDECDRELHVNDEMDNP